MAKEKKKKKGEGLPPIRCKGCGTKFVPKTRRQKYHSDNCRVEYYERHYYGKTEVIKTCPNCETQFPTTKPGVQVYCSPDCRIEAQMKRAEGVVASVKAERVTFLADRHAAMKRDGFRCTLCGRGPQDGARLDVEPDDKSGLRTVCTDCKEGRKAK